MLMEEEEEEEKQQPLALTGNRETLFLTLPTVNILGERRSHTSLNRLNELVLRVFKSVTVNFATCD